MIMQRYQVWVNGGVIVGHVEACDRKSANEMAEKVVKDFFSGYVPMDTEWSVCPINGGYYKEISDMNRSAGFNAHTDF